MRGRFITLEGIDGAGKSSHVSWMAAWLEARGISVVTTREPGGTSAGEAIRALLLQSAPALHPDTETLLMFAARCEHLARVIVPALEAGRWILCDRFTDATRAYQGGGRAVDRSRIEILAGWVQRGLEPDLTFMFDIPVAVAHERARGRTQLDRFESESEMFHERVRNVYRELAAEEPERIVVIDASKSQPEVKKELEEQLSMHMIMWNNILTLQVPSGKTS
jgi:dTMP kinase